MKRKLLYLIPILALAACGGGGSDFTSTVTGPNGETLRCDTNYRDNYTRADTECREVANNQTTPPGMSQPAADPNIPKPQPTAGGNQ